MTRTAYIRALKIGLASLAAILIIGYAVWRSLNYARGPAIVIFQPVNGSTVASSTTDLIGQASRLNSLTVNGLTVPLDQQGDFNETLVVFPGVNMITIDGTDQFGRTTQKTIEIVR